jgi:MoaA/NifB/PqqE/SkfB family radical SAM enzyme
VSIIGGEPLVRTDLAEILSAFRPDIRISLDTNGVLINQRWNETLTNRVYRVSVGLDGPPELNESFRAHTELVASNVKSLISKGVIVVSPVLISSKNFDKIEVILKYMDSLGVKKIQLNKFVPVFGRKDQEDLILSKEQERHVLLEIRRLLDEDLRKRFLFLHGTVPIILDCLNLNQVGHVFAGFGLHQLHMTDQLSRAITRLKNLYLTQ